MYHNGGRNADDSLRAAWQELAAEAQPWLLKLLAHGGAPVAVRYAFWKERLQRLRPGQRRALQRRLGVSLAGAALLLALAASPGAAAPGATITVDQTSGAIAVDGACSLPEAINNANGDSQYSAAAGECAAGSGADTITLNTDVTLTASNNSTYGPTGLPVVTSQITIEGQGNTISRSSASNFRIVAVGSGGNLTLNSATVSGGVASGAPPANYGGGIFVSAGLLTVTNSTLSGNSATTGGGIAARNGASLAVTNSTLSGNSAGNGGGGIFAFSATVAVSNSTLSYNSITYSGSGGGILANSATVTVTNSTLSGNSAGVGGGGGGIFAFSATVSVSNSTLSGNWATSRGGGIFAFSATVTVTNSTLSGNSAGGGGGGGGIYARSATVAVSNSTLSGNSASARGGGIRAFSATVAVSNSTLSGNSANYGGGGIDALSTTVTVSNSTLSGNSANYGGGGIYRSGGAVTASNSIIALQTAGGDCNTTLTSGGYNIESATTCGFTGTGDQQGKTSGELNLGALAPNGGPTQTRALSSPSVAIDQIPDGVNGCAAGVSTDQRGAVRADGVNRGGAGCDVGAYEYDSNQKPTAIALRSLSAAGGSGGAPVGWWGAVLAGLGGLGLSAFFARRRGWRRRGSGHSASALPYSAPQAAAPLAVKAATLAEASTPAYTPPAISSRGRLKQFAGSPLVVDPLALPDLE